MAFLIGGANTLDDAYDISNSIRYNSANSAYFNRTTGTPTNEDMVTISVWLKRTDVGNNNTIMSWNSGNGSQTYIDLQIVVIMFNFLMTQQVKQIQVLLQTQR